jgi:hypothetical protein
LLGGLCDLCEQEQVFFQVTLARISTSAEAFFDMPGD